MNIRIITILLLTLLAMPHAANAKTLGDEIDLGDKAQVLAKSDMAKLRGGFFDGAGLIYRFAVNVRTIFGGAQVYMRSLVVEQQNGKLQTTTNTNALDTQNLPEGTQATVINGGGGVVVMDGKGGQTTILNENGNGTPTSIINNTASNVNVSQTVNLDLTLQNMGPFMQQLNIAQENAALSNLADSISQTAIGMGY
jgi:hypothetical protein